MVQKLGKYQLTEKLGEGSMGAVYKAYDEVLDRYVAIKTMASDIQWDQELKLRFYREARSAAALHHPNIVIIHDLGEENKVPFIVMELLTGRDLKSIIRDKTPLTLEQKLLIMAQVGDGLNHAHINQIIHRDIKPGNIHVTRDLNVKILDFGIAHIPSSNLTRAGARLGTPFYMSPEQIRGDDCDERSDIFSAGIVFYELLTYVHPFLAKDMVKTMENIVFESPLPFEEQLPGAPPGLLPILSSCLEKDPNKRCRRMADLVQQCRRLIEDLRVDSKKMKSELEALIPGLRHAIEQRQASDAQVQLCDEAKALLAQEGMPDHILLHKLHSRLKKEWQPRIETAPEKKAETPPVSPVPVLEATQILPSFAEIAKKMETSPIKPSVHSPDASQTAPIAVKAVPQSGGAAPGPISDELRGRESTQASAVPLPQDMQETLAVPVQTKVGEEARILDQPSKTPMLDSKEQTEKTGKERKRRQQIQDLCRKSAESFDRKDYEAAAAQLKEALGIDPNCSQALDFMRKIESAKEESRKRQEALGLAAKARESQAKGDFENAISLLENALKILPQDPPLLALMDQAKRARADAQKQRQTLPTVEPEKAKLVRKEPAPADLPAQFGQEDVKTRQVAGREPGRGDEASVPETRPKRKRNKTVIGAAGAALFLIVAGAVTLLVWPRKDVDLSPQISLARSSLNQSLYDKAIGLSEQVLTVSPGNPEATRILKEAKEKRKQLSIDTLMLEAQTSRSRNLTDAAISALKKVLEIEPDYSPALTVLSQIEAEISATKSKEEQDRSIREWTDKAARLLSAGRINEANSEIDKVARLRPDAPELLPLRKRLKEAAARAQKEKEAMQKQIRAAGYQRKASDLFPQGKYDEAQAVLADWLREEPQNPQAVALRNQISHAQAGIKDIEAAISQRRFDDALNAVALMQKINPSDPNLGTLMKQIDEGKASAHSTLSIFRLGEPGTLLFDDQQIGVGEIENKSIPIGRHRLGIKTAQGKQFRLNLDFADGQKADFVYDASVPEIRAFTPADRALIEKRKVKEETHTYQVEHNHGMLRGKCKGVLTISGIKVSYRGSDTDHSFNYPFEQLKLVRSKERLEFSTQDNRKFTFALSSENKAEEANQLWDRLLHLTR